MWKTHYSIDYSANKKYFYISKYIAHYEGLKTKDVQVYESSGKYLWHGSNRDITFLSNNGDYFIHTSLGEDCYDECRFSHVTRRYGKDINLDGAVYHQKNIKYLSNGGMRLTMPFGNEGDNNIELDKTGGLVTGRLWEEEVQE